MHQPVDSLFNFDKRAEIGHAADSALDHRSDAVALFDGGPRIGFELLQSQRNAALARMQIEHYRFHLVPRLYHFGGMLHASRPGHFADVNEAFHSGLELHERTVVSDIHHSPYDAAADRILLLDGK